MFIYKLKSVNRKTIVPEDTYQILNVIISRKGSGLRWNFYFLAQINLK